MATCSNPTVFSQTLRLSFQNFFIVQLIYGTCMACVLIPTFFVVESAVWFAVWLNHGIMALIPFGVGIVLTTLLVALQDVWLGFRVDCGFNCAANSRKLGCSQFWGVYGFKSVWILVSVLQGARIGGLLGVIVAVPCCCHQRRL